MIIRINTSVRDLSLNLDTAIPCGLIVTELVSNALKHAFRESDIGEIKVELSSVDKDTYQLVVSDDGTGLPDGWDLANLSTLGLKLVHSFVEQLSGTLDVISDAGTTFKILFREYEEYQGAL